MLSPARVCTHTHTHRKDIRPVDGNEKLGVYKKLIFNYTFRVYEKVAARLGHV